MEPGLSLTRGYSLHPLARCLNMAAASSALLVSSETDFKIHSYFAQNIAKNITLCCAQTIATPSLCYAQTITTRTITEPSYMLCPDYCQFATPSDMLCPDCYNAIIYAVLRLLLHLHIMLYPDNCTSSNLLCLYTITMPSYILCAKTITMPSHNAVHIVYTQSPRLLVCFYNMLHVYPDYWYAFTNAVHRLLPRSSLCTFMQMSK